MTRHLLKSMIVVLSTTCSMTLSAQSIGSGYGHGIGICTDSTVMTWGWNLSGQLGNGYPTFTGDCQCFTYAAPIAYLDSVVAVVGGEYHSVALRADGTVRVWGLGASGQLGYGFYPTNPCSCAALPVQPIGLPPITSIAAGEDHTLAIADDSTVWAWGDNSHGELGDGIGFAVASPVHVVGLSNVVSIGCGNMHSLAIKNDGTVWAWGWNISGQLGDTTHTTRLTPVQVYGLTDVIAVDGGSLHSAALKNDGTVWVWGTNYYHQLLDTALVDTAAPIRIPGLNDVRAIACGRYHTVVLKNDSTVWSWGYSYNGNMGDGSSGGLYPDTLVQATGITGVVEIAAEGDHTMALKSDGTVWSWGYNYYGQLGDNTRLNRSTAVRMWNLCDAAIALDDIDPDTPDPIRISPNPFNDQLQVTSSSLNSATQFRITALTGEMVLNGALRNGTINTNTLAPGCYLLDVFDAALGPLMRTRIVKL